MSRDYLFTSPSLDGVLSHDSIAYEGIKRPFEVIRSFDRPSSKKERIPSVAEQELLAQYLQDLYSVFLKKFSNYMSIYGFDQTESLKLQAMLQEIIKVKDLLSRKKDD